MAEQGFQVPLIIRGRVILDRDLEFGGRRGGASFASADVRKHLAALTVDTPSSLQDLYRLRFDELLDYLADLGTRLSLDRNPYVNEAFELSRRTSGLSVEQLRNVYRTFGRLFNRDYLREMMERTVGVKYLEDWVEGTVSSGARVAIRAFGARAVHIVAGNHPGVSALTIARNALTRSDAIIKTPSNDPLTAAAIARTMVDMAPDHPLTKHLSVAYWKGGDAEVEEILYQPRNIEKIIAWGGFASISHISKYIQPGIDLITLDPKLSSTIIGKDAFADARTMRSVAERLAVDVGANNQEGCINARVIYVESGTDPQGVANAKSFGKMLYDAIQALPSHVSAQANTYDPELAEEIQGLRLASMEHDIIGGGVEGGVIVSHHSDPVDFARLLYHRTANLVPVDDLEIPIRAVTAYTQTIGIYPETLKAKIRDRLALHGAQRLVSLGYASNSNVMSVAGPQDAIEPTRRMCRWIVDEACDPGKIPLLSQLPAAPGVNQ